MPEKEAMVNWLDSGFYVDDPYAQVKFTSTTDQRGTRISPLPVSYSVSITKDGVLVVHCWPADGFIVKRLPVRKEAAQLLIMRKYDIGRDPNKPLPEEQL